MPVLDNFSSAEKITLLEPVCYSMPKLVRRVRYIEFLVYYAVRAETVINL